MDDKCHECGEPFFPGQRYFAAPTKVHVVCRKYRDEVIAHDLLMHAVRESGQAPGSAVADSGNASKGGT
jgi:hypothetical protein